MSPAGEVRTAPASNLAARLLEAAAKATQGERVRVRIGRRRVAIVPVEDLRFLERLEDEEDLRDVRAFRAEAMSNGTIPWDQVKASLGLEKGDHEPPAPPERTKRATECAERAVPARGRPLRVEEGGRVVGFPISDENFELFRRLLDAEEDRLDVAATREALREVGSVSLEELVDEVGL